MVKTTSVSIGPRFQYLTDEFLIREAILGHSLHNPLVLDLETTGLNPFKDRVLDVVISSPHDAEGAIMFPEKYIELLRDVTAPLILHNFKFDFRMLANYGVDLRDRLIYDTMLLHHLHDENKPHNLDSIIKEHFQDNYKEVFWDRFENYSDADLQSKLEYACKDVVYTRKVYDILRIDLTTQGIPDSLIRHAHSMALSLYNTELEGVKVDTQFLMELGTEFKTSEEILLKDLRQAADHECSMIELDMWAKEINKRKSDKGKAKVKKPDFNFSSTQQIQDLLYNKLKLPVIKDPKTWKPTASDYALQKLAGKHPVASKLQELRKVQKMQSSFVEGVLTEMHESRVHPSFNVNGTVTGRISCSQPNLQQMPARGAWAKIRGMFVPDPGHSFVTCDYSQLEICIAAHYSADPILVKMVKDGDSMHDYTAQACGITRDQAKKMNFTVLYGGTAYKVAQDLNCSQEQAQVYLDMLLNAYAGLRDIINLCHIKVEKGEPIQSVFGRIRHFSAKYESDVELNRAKRQAFNSLIQGTGADITHTALWQVDKELRNRDIGRAVFAVHDEIVIACKTEKYTEAFDILTNTMINVGKEVNLLVPLRVDCSGALERWNK